MENEIIELAVGDYRDYEISDHAVFNDITALTDFLEHYLREEYLDPLFDIRKVEFKNGILSPKDNSVIEMLYPRSLGGMPMFRIKTYD